MVLPSALVILLFLLEHCDSTRKSPRCIYNCQIHNDGPADREAIDDTTITEEEIQQELLRIEGQRILEKLRLDKPPVVSVSLNELPAPVVQRIANGPMNEEVEDEGNEETLGRTKTLYILGERPRRGRGRSHRCSNQHGRPATCVEFEINGRALTNHPMMHVALWLNLYNDDEERDSFTAAPSYFTLSVYALHRNGHEERIVDTTGLTVSRDGQWVSVNLSDFIQREIDTHQRMHRITLLVVTCAEQDSCNRSISFAHTASRRPFLEIQTQRSSELEANETRRKRSKLCTPGWTSDSECCMETFYVNFTQLGWHTWILQPRGYRTGYCKGRCMSTATRNYNAIMRAVIQRRKEQREQAIRPKLEPIDKEMAPCCFPLRLLPLEILYAKIEHNNEQLSTAVLPSMIVDSCRC